MTTTRPLLDAITKHQDKLGRFAFQYICDSARYESLEMTRTIVRGGKSLRSYSVPKITICILPPDLKWEAFPNYGASHLRPQYDDAEEALLEGTKLLNYEFSQRRAKLDKQMDESLAG